MQELYDKLKQFSLKDDTQIEKSDRQFIALKNLYNNIKNKELYLPLIIANSLICYQLSWKWEDYWEEFSEYFSSYDLEEDILIKSLWSFIKGSKNNKRFIETKIKRLEKIKPFLYQFIWKQEYYYAQMLELRNNLAKTMKQKVDAKNIIFAVKIFFDLCMALWHIEEYLLVPKECFLILRFFLLMLFFHILMAP